MMNLESQAIQQRSLGDPSIRYPLLPPLTAGCPHTSTGEIQYPVEVEFDYDAVPLALFDQPAGAGLDRWAPLLPPLAEGLSMAEGGTPLLAVPQVASWAGVSGELFIKDESRNPTWSHKDRLNLCAVSAAVVVGAPGVVVASSGNHGAAAAAYAARAGLPCIVLTSDTAPPAIQSFLMAYGAAVLGVPTEARWPVMRQIVDRLGYHPVSNLTRTHTGHAWGPEGYKTIAYELFLQLGRRLPSAVFVPTGYAEMLFGVWKGFHEMQQLGVTHEMPRMIACEPAARAPLARALAEGKHATAVDARPTDAYAVAVTIGGYRGVIAVRDSEGSVMPVTDENGRAAQATLARTGMWVELSSAISLAGVRQAVVSGEKFDGPVVAIVTSSGFKDIDVGQDRVPVVSPDWTSVAEALARRYGINIDS
jgi:threonine synthase